MAGGAHDPASEVEVVPQSPANASAQQAFTAKPGRGEGGATHTFAPQATTATAPALPGGTPPSPAPPSPRVTPPAPPSPRLAPPDPSGVDDDSPAEAAVLPAAPTEVEPPARAAPPVPT